MNEKIIPQTANCLVPAPLERLKTLPADLNGYRGANRQRDATRLQIAAANDLEAVRKFVVQFALTPNTYSAYQRDAERLLLWAVIERHKPLSSLTIEDFNVYLEFLANPKPAERWIGQRALRGSDAWKPFNSALSPSSVHTSFRIIDSMFTWFVDVGYLNINPLSSIRQLKKKIGYANRHGGSEEPTAGSAKQLYDALHKGTPKLHVEHFLTEEMRSALFAALEKLPQNTDDQKFDYERQRFLVHLMFMLAPRVSEISGNTMSSFRDYGDGVWMWEIVRKGSQWKKVSVPDDMLQSMVRFRKFLGLPPLPKEDDVTPLFPRRDSGRRKKSGTHAGIRNSQPAKLESTTARQINNIIDVLAASAADILLERAPAKTADAEKLRLMSSHWGRHTGITIMRDSGMSRDLMTKDAGHNSPLTSDLYTHDEIRARWKEGQKRKMNYPS